tara:strand:+ start:12150 stop:13382 length:1233 start_codon:yes stop_codon:yes gene_type:complete
MKKSLKKLQDLTKNFVNLMGESSSMHMKGVQNTIEVFVSKFVKGFESEGEISKQSPIWMQSTLVGLMVSASFGIVWLSIAKTEEIVTVTGKLEPQGSVQEIQMPLGGIASEILVKEGDSVLAGQIVMRLDAETAQKRVDSLKESQKLKTHQLELKQQELEQFLLINSEEISVLETNLFLQKKILLKFKKLFEEGATSELQFLQQQNKVSEDGGRLSQKKIDRLRQQAVQNQAIQQLKADLQELEARLTEASVNLRYQALKSPVDGVVFDLQPRGNGYVAQGTETVMKVVPYDVLEANVEIPSNQIGFVQVGMPADISIDSFPATDFGVLEGKIKSIGSDALSPSQFENRAEYRYPAMIELSSQKFELKNGERLPLQVGMSLTSNIKLRKVSYLQLLLGTFQDKVDSLRQL